MTHLERGTTLIELLMTLGVIGIVTTISVSGMNTLVESTREHSAFQLLQRDIRAARYSAITNNKFVTLCRWDGQLKQCKNEGRWEDGWMMYESMPWTRKCTDQNTDNQCDANTGKILKIQEPIKLGRFKLSDYNKMQKAIRFEPSGSAEGFPGTFVFCHPDDASQSKQLVVAMSGRIQTREGMHRKCN